MKFLLIDPKARRLRVEWFPDLFFAKLEAGLEPDQVDHGHVARNLSVVVFEFSLFVPPEEQCYFSLGSKLFGGSAVMYQTDAAGETIDFNTTISTAIFPNPGWLRWYRSVAEIEAAISGGTLVRPQTMLNDTIIWAWNR